MPPSTSTSRARRRPAALGRNCGGPDDGGVAAVRHPEGLVHVGVEALDQRGHEGRVVALLARRRSAGCPSAPRRGTAPPAARAPDPSPSAGRGCRPVGPRCEQATTSAPWSSSQRRVGSAARDAEVVGHGGPPVDPDVERHVEVHPHQDTPPFEVGQVLEEWQPVPRRSPAQPPTSTVRSTRRFE